MKILVLSNLYPPYHAGTFDLHCESVVNALKLRGHTVLVLTSSHGLRTEQRDSEIERRLWLNGAFGHDPVTKYGELKALEIHNHEVLNEAVQQFQPELIFVFSLRGISKSFIWGVRNKGVRVVYDVSDDWLSTDVRMDPWLRFWNAPSLPFLDQTTRKALELSGERGRVDCIAPTRLAQGYDRMPSLYGDAKAQAAVQPNSISEMRFDRVYFCSGWLKQQAELTGFCVNHAEIIHPGISTQSYMGDVKPPNVPVKKFLIADELTPKSGVLTALKALKKLREARFNCTLGICGTGDTSYIATVRSFVVANQLPVEFLNVSNISPDMAGIYKRHDVLLYTPEWPEPFPTAPLQAMACGLPVIGAAIGGAGELLRHGENALSYEAGNVDQLAGRMQEIQMSPALRCQMADTAQQEALSLYNETTITDQIENYLIQTFQTTDAAPA